MKKKVTFRIDIELFNQLENYSKDTGLSKTEIIERALKQFFKKDKQDYTKIELYKKENEQLKVALKVFHEREKALEEVKNTFERLLNEKDERIKELKEQLEKQSKPFWKFW